MKEGRKDLGFALRLCPADRFGLRVVVVWLPGIALHLLPFVVAFHAYRLSLAGKRQGGAKGVLLRKLVRKV